jgi:hypothetical protein
VARQLHHLADVEATSRRIDQLKRRIDQMRVEYLELAGRHPRLVRSLLAGFGIIAALSIIGPVWYFIDLQ